MPGAAEEYASVVAGLVEFGPTGTNHAMRLAN